MTELEKYKFIYSSKDVNYSEYGHTNHGKAAYEFVESLCPTSIVDIGCGHNEFCKHFRQRGVSCLGVDFACESADIIGSATQLPLSDKAIDLLTSFDMLEHLLPIEVDMVFHEFARVSRRFIFSISYVASQTLVHGENLHPSVFPKEWWVNKISEFGISLSYQNYLFGKWK